MKTNTKRRQKATKSPTRASRQRLSIVRPEYRVQYLEEGIAGINCGDAVAEALANEHTDLDEVAKANKIDIERWAHLNPGHRRMCLGNRLRGMVRSGQTVHIGKETIQRT